MTRYLSTTLLGTVLLATSCAAPVDMEQERAALLDRDRAWAQTLPDVDVFMSFFATDASFLPPDMPAVTGTEAIRDVVTQLSSMPGFAVTWTATKAEVGSGGDLGYTQGTVEMTLNGPDGMPVTETSKYVTVWEKNAAGEWMVVADIFNSTAAPSDPAANS